MRKIKFRAWDEPSQSFVEDAMPHKARHFEQPLMQYTGLKDKNGKEIYEGDIVLWVTDVFVETIEGHSRTEPEGQIGSMKFDRGAFYINGGDFYSYGEQMFDWNEIEVIGNIYQNPELLNA